MLIANIIVKKKCIKNRLKNHNDNEIENKNIFWGEKKYQKKIFFESEK